jgi:predicted lipid-binding transport protein (Tim44 family)
MYAMGRALAFNNRECNLLSIFLPKWAGGVVTFEIILLAMVAAFLGFRLYAVLGKRNGHEQEPLVRQPVEERSAPSIQPPKPNMEPMPGGVIPLNVDIDVAAQSGLRAIINADRSFDSELFIHGARAAYAATLEAYWHGDREALRFLCDDDVYASFGEAIDAREARGEVLANRLVRIESARIVAASFDHPVARITMQFDADIAAMVKDRDGNVIGGSMSDAVEANDVWTFMRDIKSGDRNWTLDETDEA